MKVLLWLFPLLAVSCSSLKPYPADDKRSSDRWLELGAGSFQSTSRTIITDDTMVQESYQRTNWGRKEGSHLIAGQRIDTLSPATSQRFWAKVDQLRLFRWTGKDMPPLTVSILTTYRKGEQSISLSDLQNPHDQHPSARDEVKTYPRYEALNRAIRELEKEVAGATKPAS